LTNKAVILVKHSTFFHNEQ